MRRFRLIARAISSLAVLACSCADKKQPAQVTPPREPRPAVSQPAAAANARTEAPPREAAARTSVLAGSSVFLLSAPAIAPGQQIPSRFSCEGQDISPALAWQGVPAAAKSLALIVDDPDAPDPKAPKMTWVHWVLFDIPPTAKALPEGAKRDALPAGTREGTNDWKRTGYGGPCPPIGRHRYFHKLYALDAILGDIGAATKADLERAMKGHILATAELMATYEKTAR